MTDIKICGKNFQKTNFQVSLASHLPAFDSFSVFCNSSWLCFSCLYLRLVVSAYIFLELFSSPQDLGVLLWPLLHHRWLQLRITCCSPISKQLLEQRLQLLAAAPLIHQVRQWLSNVLCVCSDYKIYHLRLVWYQKTHKQILSGDLVLKL